MYYQAYHYLRGMFIIPLIVSSNVHQISFNLTHLFCCRPGLSSVVTGFLPSVILKGFIYIVPFAMFGMAKLPGCISKSKEEIKACNMVFYFLVGNVFFLSVLSGSLLDEIGESFSHPKNFPSHLASAVSAQVSLVNLHSFSVFLSLHLFFCFKLFSVAVMKKGHKKNEQAETKPIYLTSVLV